MLLVLFRKLDVRCLQSSVIMIALGTLLPNRTRASIASGLGRRTTQQSSGSWRKDATARAFILEAWGEGCMVGALIIMACVTAANMRKGVMLHKLILLEVCRGSTPSYAC